MFSTRLLFDAGRVTAPIAASVFFISSSFAASSLAPSFTYQGRLLNEAGTAPLEEVVDLKLGIYNPSGNCLLYEETQNGIDLGASGGVFSVGVGSGKAPSADAVKRTAKDPGKTMAEVFSNVAEIRAAGSPDCAAGYTPQVGHGRKLRVTITPLGGGASSTLSPDLEINSVPQSHVADTLQGLDASRFVQISGNATPYTVSKSALDVLLGIGGVQDASSLHAHDSLYAKIAGSSSVSLSSGGYLGLGVHAGNPSTAGWAGDPTKIGRTWFDSGSGEIKYWDGSAIKTLGVSGSAVSSFNTRTGAVTLLSADVTGALGFTPQNAANIGADTKASLSETANNPVKYSSLAGSFYMQNGATSGDTLRWDGAQWQVGADARHWASNGTDVYRASGNVGIGTTDPQYEFEVSKSGTFFTQVGITNTTASSTGGARIQFNNDSGAIGQIFSPSSAYAASQFRSRLGVAGDANGTDIIASAATGDVRFYTGGTSTANERVRIGSTGNVGIGTTNPASRLEVMGNIQLTAGAPRQIKVSDAAAGANADSLSVLSGSATGAGNGAGGVLSLAAGSGRGTAAGGSVSLLSGGGGATGAGGNVYLIAGSSGNTAASAWINIQGGMNNGTPGGDGGPINIIGGTSTNQKGGNVFINGGAGGVTRGNVILANQGGNVGIGTTSPEASLQISKTDTSTVGNIYGLQISNTYNQLSSFANNTDLLINRTETSVGSGVQFLINAQVSGQSKFAIRNDGHAFFFGTAHGNISGSGGVGDLVGISATPQDLLFSGPPRTGNVIGVFAAPATQGSQATANVYGVKSAYDVALSSVTNVYNYYSANPATHAGASISNAYGLYLENISSGVANYSIYSAGGKSYFAGNVGIGTTEPAYKLDVNGDIRIATGSKLYVGTTPMCDSTGCTAAPSDSRYKTNVARLENALGRITTLEGVSYDWLDQEKFSDKRQIGFIAQDVEKIFPEIVKTDENTGFKSVMYDKLAAPIVEAIKTIVARVRAQDQKIASLEESSAAKLAQLEAENAELKQKSDAMLKVICELKPGSPICERQ